MSVVAVPGGLKAGERTHRRSARGATPPVMLMIAQLPPPVHGASIMNQFVANADWLRREYIAIPIPMQFASSVGDIGRPRMSKLLRLATVWGALIRACVSRRPAFAYFTISPTGAALWRDLTIVALLRGFHVPILFHIHGKGLGRDDATRLQRACYRWAFRDGVVIQLSWGLYREVADLLPESKVRIVPNGVPDLVAAMGPRAARRVPRVLFLSNMVPEKGIYEVLEAVEALRRDGVEVTADFVGPFLSDRVREEFLASVVRKDLSGVVRVIGPAYGDERLRFLAEADLFVFPSYYGPEAFPLAVLEAMAAGLPVIGARTGAIPDMIEDSETGLLIPVRDPGALASAIRKLVGDTELRLRMGASARAKYEREYRLERFLESMRVVFSELGGSTESGGEHSESELPLSPERLDDASIPVRSSAR